jgi:hypothetical protein
MVRDKPRATVTTVLAGALGIAGVSLFAVESGGSTPSGTAPAAVTSVQATQAGTSPDLTVTWVPAPTGVAATGAVVQLYDLVNKTYTYMSEETCGASCESTVFRNLSFGTTYEAAVYAIASGLPALPVDSAPVTPSTSCLVAACVSVDATSSIGAANRAAAGVLSSVFNVGNVIKDMTALGTTMFRSSPSYNADGTLNWTNWNVATKSGTKTTLVLSDLWSATNGGNPPTPWSDWSAYTSFITSTVSTIVASGEQVDYWEVYNEPGGSGYYSAANYATVTPALLLQQFLLTYQAIRAVDPSAAIIGPSLAVWSDYPNQNGTTASPDPTFDMATFLTFAATNGLQLAAISWHEINDTLGPNPEENALFPANVEDQVATARRLIAALPQLGNPLIFINEYGIPEVQSIPGWDVAYLSALTDAQVSSAGTACWPSTACANPTLDGLLADDGVGTMPDYWVHTMYASLSGHTVATTSTNDFVTALASFNSTTNTVTGLIGRGEGCTQVAFCATTLPTDNPQAAIDTTVTLTVPWAAGTAKVALADVPGQDLTPVAEPIATDTTATINPAGTGTGTITVSIPSFADGDAYGLTVTPLTLTTPPPTTTTTTTTTTTSPPTTTTTRPPTTTTTTRPPATTTTTKLPTTTTVPPVTTPPTSPSSPAIPPSTPPTPAVTIKSGGYFGSAGALHLNKPIVGMASTPDGGGYWLVASDGGIFTFGDASYFGSTGALRLNKPIVGMASTPTGKGYWLIASDGGIFTFGDAGYYGSTGNSHLNKPIVGMASTPTGKGYWLVASDGGIFTFGNARYFGSTGALALNKPIVGIGVTSDGSGYWLAASDGGIFTFGDAGYFGSTGALHLAKPIVGIAAATGGGGYRLVASDGGIFTFGFIGYFGSAGGEALNKPIVGMASTPNGYWLVASDGGIFSFGT